MSTQKVYTDLERALMIGGLMVLVVSIVVAVLVANLSISNTGKIVTIGVNAYSDPAGVNPLTSINWGSRMPGDQATVTAYIKNTSTNLNVTLSLATSNWVPTVAAKYLTLSWNYTSGYVLTPSKIIPVALTLSVAQNITGVDSFSFTITITATEKT